MKEKIFKNFSLKVLSVVCAMILWAIIVNVNDPNTGYTFSNVTVQLINTESLTDNGYTYEVVDGGKISVYVSGPKSVVTDLKASDIVATADLSKISAFADYVDISVQIIKDGTVRTDVEATPKTSAVKLSIDNRISQTFNIGIINTGSFADGYSVVSQSVSPNTVRITGSSGLISSIDSVNAVVDVNGVNSDLTMTVPITLYDADDNVISFDGLELSKTEVDYTAKVQMTKIIPVKVNIAGTAADGYTVSSAIPNINQITIAGSGQILGGIHEVVISTDQITISNLKENRTFSVDVSKLLPQDVSVLSENDVQVEVKVSSGTTRSITMDLSQVQMTNLSNSSSYTAVATGDLAISIQGEKAVVDAVKSTDIKMSVDLTGLTEGTHEVPLTVTLPTGCTLSGSYKASITIKANEQSTTQQTTAAH